MPATVPAMTITVTKNSTTGNFQFLLQNPLGGIRMCFALLSADMATAAALGSGASTTLTYSQDGTLIAGGVGPSRADYPNSYTMETF
jgi:hypothetical protein